MNQNMTPQINNMSPGKIQHIFDVIDRKSGKHGGPMQNDLSKIYMRQGQDGPSEIRKRNEGEWGTLPANTIPS